MKTQAQPTKASSTILENRMKAREFWRSIPKEKVARGLNVFIDGDNEAVHKHASSSSPGEAMECGTVACLAGWLVVLSEVIAHTRMLQQKYGYPSRVVNSELSDRISCLHDWLGLNEFTSDVFDPVRLDERGNSNPTDWDVAMERLDNLVKDAGGT